MQAEQMPEQIPMLPVPVFIVRAALTLLGLPVAHSQLTYFHSQCQCLYFRQMAKRKQMQWPVCRLIGTLVWLIIGYPNHHPTTGLSQRIRIRVCTRWIDNRSWNSSEFVKEISFKSPEKLGAGRDDNSAFLYCHLSEPGVKVIHPSLPVVQQRLS